MAKRQTAAKGEGASASRTSSAAKGFTADERAAMRERARELKS